MTSRIWFPKNPWPAGHAIVKQQWSGRLDAERGLVFDLHLESARYDAERKFEDVEDEDGDWNAPSVWTNYGRCSLSSTKWNHAGFVVGTAKKPFDWSALDGTTFRVDKAKDELPEDPRAFGIYLTGHDAVADHSIAFTKTARTWAVSWKAKIALAYIGRTKLEHRMKAELQKLTFEGFVVAKGAKPASFETLVTDPKAWKLEKNRFVRR